MDIVKAINKFTGDIYFKKSQDLMIDYYKIVEEFNGFVNSISTDKELIVSKNEMLLYLSDVQQTRDFTKMADALNEVLIPVMVDLLNTSTQ